MRLSKQGRTRAGRGAAWVRVGVALALTLAAALSATAEECWDAQRMSRYQDMLPNYIVRPHSVEIEYKLEMAAVGEGRTLASEVETEMGVAPVQVASFTTMIERAGPGQPLLPKGLVFNLPVVLVPHEGDYETAVNYGFRNDLPVAFRFSAAQGELGTLSVGPSGFGVNQRSLAIEAGPAKVLLEGVLGGGFSIELLVDGEVYARATDPRGFFTFYSETIYPRMQRFAALEEQGLCE